MSKGDKTTYIMIKIIGIIAVSLISYFIIFTTMNLMNTTEYAKTLIDMNIYTPFYSILNFISQMCIPIIVIMVNIAIPYLIVSIVVIIMVIKKYIRYKGEKAQQIIKIILLGILTVCFVIKGISLLPLTSEYVIEVNQRVNDISNEEIREYLEVEIGQNKYVYKIQIRQGFPDDYNVKIYYKGKSKQVKTTFLSDYDYNFIEKYAKEITNELSIKSIILTLLGDILCICLLIYTLKEFKRIS